VSFLNNPVMSWTLTSGWQTEQYNMSQASLNELTYYH